MAGIDEIKKSLLSENDVYKYWPEDLQGLEETYPYASELAKQMLGKGGEEALEDFAGGRFSRENMPTAINTYPFGEKTTKVYPEFIGVCNGSTKLSDLFRAILQQLKRYMSDTNMGQQQKTITIFTDKWDPGYLKKNEALFLKAILHNNVIFNFYLVTDYGITRIPFMSRVQTEEYKRRFAREIIEEASSLEEILEKNDIGCVEYTVDQSDSWIPGYNQMKYRYEFDFRNLRYRFEDNKGENEIGTINKAYALRFIRAAMALKNAGGLDSHSRPTNYVQKWIDFGSFSFSWYECTDVEDVPEVARMLEALMLMESTLKKELPNKKMYMQHFICYS